jgi:probable rRNA maturation factor
MSNIQLNWENEQTDILLPETLAESLARLTVVVAEHESLTEGELTVLFVNDEAIQTWNRDYRGMDKPTDVLSFAMMEAHDDEPDINYATIGDAPEPLPQLLGDIVISVERAQAQAVDYGHSLLRELCFLYVHGFLHLLGYDHMTEEEERIMLDRQSQILEKAGIHR